MENPKVEPRIAYLCDGYDKCSFEPGCYKREDLISKSDWTCNHTFNPEHALNGLCDDPDAEPDRWKMILNEGSRVYYETTSEEDP